MFFSINFYLSLKNIPEEIAFPLSPMLYFLYMIL